MPHVPMNPIPSDPRDTCVLFICYRCWKRNMNLLLLMHVDRVSPDKHSFAWRRWKPSSPLQSPADLSSSICCCWFFGLLPGLMLKDWCWSWNSNTLATWCKELTHLKRPWCWEKLKVGREGDNRRWDGWMASLTQGTWVWVNSGSWWWTGRPGMLWFMGSQRVRHDWATELSLTWLPLLWRATIRGYL